MIGRNWKNVLFVICALEIVYYMYEMTFSLAEFLQIYYEWQMRITMHWDMETTKWLMVQLVASTLSFWSTLGLLAVAWTDGEFLFFIYVYCGKNMATIIIELILFGRNVISFRSQKTDLSAFMLSIFLGIPLGVVFPLVAGLIAADYHRWIGHLNEEVRVILDSYEAALKAKQVKKQKKQKEKLNALRKEKQRTARMQSYLANILIPKGRKRPVKKSRKHHRTK